MIYEVVFKLDKDLGYYQDLMNKNNFNFIYKGKIHDIYYTNKILYL